ncbi:MAG: hypothetical protein A2423_00140 [Candidatus Levybacteria bacterium RIFOXYC1_FULL_40_10]|nr:MAG: hypothetical protein A2423_00140 [Candidatus Levybacteria bacterium RIFOXYC1_FULL_40_10]
MKKDEESLPAGRQVEFKVGDETLRGSLFVPSGKGPFPGVVFFHGSGGIGEMYFEAAESLAERGIVGFAFNYRGAGVSEGIFEEQTLKMGIADAETAFKFFIAQPEIHEKRIGICGASFGGYIAALISNLSNVKSLILVGPAAYLSTDLNRQRDDAGDSVKDFTKSNSFDEIEKFKGKLLVMTSEFDEVIPPEVIEGYLKRAKSATRVEQFVLKGAEHRISINPQARRAFIKKTTDWFLKTL